MTANRVRFTIRRWLILIASSGLILGGGVSARDWLRAHRRLISASNALERTLRFYDEGRVTCDRVAISSRRVRDARRDLARSRAERIAAMEDHLRLIEALRGRERDGLELNCRGGLADLAELEQFLDEDRALLAVERGVESSGPAR